jgi:hypothetical protein
MPINSTHPDYEAAALDSARARDVLRGEDAVKAAGERYLPRLDSQTPEEQTNRCNLTPLLPSMCSLCTPYVLTPASGSEIGRFPTPHEAEFSILRIHTGSIQSQGWFDSAIPASGSISAAEASNHFSLNY